MWLAVAQAIDFQESCSQDWRSIFFQCRLVFRQSERPYFSMRTLRILLNSWFYYRCLVRVPLGLFWSCQCSSSWPRSALSLCPNTFLKMSFQMFLFHIASPEGSLMPLPRCLCHMLSVIVSSADFK